MATITENIAETHWVPNEYKYYLRVLDEGMVTVCQWEITSRPVNYNQTFSITQPLFPVSGYSYACIYAVDRSSGEEALLSYDDAYMDLTWGGENGVNVLGETYDASTGNHLGEVIVTATQLGQGHSTESNQYDGSYSIAGLDLYKSIGINGTKDGYTGVPIFFTPYQEGEYTVDIGMIPNGGPAPGAWYNVTGGKFTVLTHSDETTSYYNLTEDGTAIGGYITLDPYWTAGESVSVTLSNATWSDTNTSNAAGWYQLNNLPAGGAYTLSMEKTGYKNTNTSVTVFESAFNRVDAHMTGAYVLTVYVRDLTSGGLLSGESVTCQLDTGEIQVTTSGICTFNDCSYGVHTVTASCVGRYPCEESVVVDASKIVSCYSQEVPETPTQSTSDNALSGESVPIAYPHQVRFVVQWVWGTPIPNVNVTATAIESSGPWEWIMGVLGMNTTPAINATTLNGWTGSDGSWTAMMVESVRYRVEFTNASLGVNEVITTWPKEDNYEILVMPGAQPDTTECLNYTLTANQYNATWYNLTLWYKDVCGGTTSLQYRVSDGNNTVIHTQTVSNPTNITIGWLVPQVPGGIYYFGFNATNTKFQNEIKYDRYISWPKESGKLIPWDAFGVTVPDTYYDWAGIGMIVVIGALASKVIVKYVAIFMTFFADLWMVLGWWPTTMAGLSATYGTLTAAVMLWTFLGTATFIAIFFYMRSGAREEQLT